MKGVADLITLIQKTKHDLSMDRRWKILNAQLNRKYRKHGSAEVPITDLLFRSDLKAACANFDTTSKMGPVKCKQKSEGFSTKHVLRRKTTGTGTGYGVQEKPGHPKAECEDMDIPRQSVCLLYTSPSPRDWSASRMPSSA